MKYVMIMYILCYCFTFCASFHAFLYSYNKDLSSLLSEVAEERDKVNESFHLMEDNHNSLRSELEAVKVSSLNFQSQLTETIRNLNDVSLLYLVPYITDM